MSEIEKQERTILLKTMQKTTRKCLKELKMLATGGTREFLIFIISLVASFDV